MTTANFESAPHTAWEVAKGRIAPDHAVVLWKPGCEFSAQLLADLADDSSLTWVNIEEDDAARERIREVNDGNELTPTVLVGDRVLRNPSASELRALLHN